MSVSVHPSTLAPQLLAGVERTLVAFEVMTLFICVLLYGLGFVTGALTFVVVTVVHPFFRRMGKEDPILTRIYSRSLRVQNFYPPVSDLTVAPARPLPFRHGLY